jgi:hypothetical protein
VVTAWQTISRDDVAGLNRQLGQARKVEAELLQPLAATGAKITKQRSDDAQHNAEVIGADAKRQKANLKKFEGEASDLLDVAAPRESAADSSINDFSADALL